MVLVKAVCEKGHEQVIQTAMPLAWAQQWAALMDGSSSFYIYPPRGTDSAIGKCGICGAQIECEVIETEDTIEPQEGRDETS